MLTCDLVLTDVRVVDVFRLRVYRGWVGIRKGIFLYVEEGSPPSGLTARETRGMEGLTILPGLIDSHMHIESSLLTPRRFAEAVLPHGTTTVLADPHEVANAGGEAGLRWFMETSRNLPLDIRIALPSCVPATSREVEWVRESLDADTVRKFCSLPGVIALGELMDYRRLLDERAKEEGTLWEMIQVAREQGVQVEGHIPTLRGVELSEYISSGIGSDHTLTNPEKLVEQLTKGLAVMLQEKSLTPEVIRAVGKLSDRSQVFLVTDDVEPSLLREGHLSLMVRKAVEGGMDPLEAIASATIRPARYLGLDRGIWKKGAIAPGYTADFLVVDGPVGFPPREVWVGGNRVAVKGRFLGSLEASSPGEAKAQLPGPFTSKNFLFPPEICQFPYAQAIRVMDDRTSLTRLERVQVAFRDGFPLWEGEASECCAASVISRNGEYRSFALICNLGLKAGGYASSFAHDSHNLLVVGRDPHSMARAAQAVREGGGGIAVVKDTQEVIRLELPIFGILSDEPVDRVASKLEELERILRSLGIRRARPFLILSLLSLSVSPYAKLTDRGIVDTEKRTILSPFSKE